MRAVTARRTIGWLFMTALALTARPQGVDGQVRQQPVLRVPSDSTMVQELHLRDGTKLIGRIASVDGERVRFETLGGLTVDLPRGDIVRVREVQGFHADGQFWEHDAANSRLFVFPTGRVPTAGRGYFGVYELFVPSFGVGLGGVGMLSGGMSLIPGIAIDEQVFFIGSKVRFLDLAFVQAAAGAMWVQPGDSEEGAGFGYGVVTAGTDRGAVTFGFGLPLFHQEAFDTPVAYILGGELRVTRNVKLMSESVILPAANDGYALGVRILTGRVIVELAAVTATDVDFVLPLVNVTLSW